MIPSTFSHPYLSLFYLASTATAPPSGHPEVFKPHEGSGLQSFRLGGGMAEAGFTREAYCLGQLLPTPLGALLQNGHWQYLNGRL